MARRVFFLAALTVLISKSLSNDSGTCPATNADCQGDNVKFGKYLREIAEARANYTPCTASDCSCFDSVLEDDLAPFQDGITKDMVEWIHGRAVKYQIIDHRLYRSRECMFEPRCRGVEHFLLELAPVLPDLEFYLNPRDYPHAIKRPAGDKAMPVFSFSKVPSRNWDIMYPAWSFWAGGPAISLFPTGIGRWDQLRDQLKQAAERTPWHKKKTVAFFRGSRTSDERDPLVLLSRAKPDIVDAKYTKNQAYKSEKDTLNEPAASEIHFTDHCPYKYLFNFRGVAASFRFKHLFLCKSVVFHVGDEWIEFFYPALKPWIHYVPVSSTLNDLEEILEFARTHDDEMKVIAEQGYDFIWNHLRMEDVTCCWRRLLTEYAALLRYRVKLDESLIEVKN